MLLSKKKILGALIDNGERTASSNFVNYGGFGKAEESGIFAETLGGGISKYDLYYGINQGNSAFSGGYAFKTVLNKDKHVGSMAIFLERAVWRAGYRDDKYNLGVDYLEKFFKYANKYWVGSKNPNPSDDRWSEVWPGIANHIPARTTIQSKPFCINF